MDRMQRIYLDASATTPVYPEVVNAMLPYFYEEYGNPSSLYEQGRKAREAVENARTVIANSIHAEPEEIIFTSGASESNRIIADYSDWLITSTMEHTSLLSYADQTIGVDDYGIVNEISIYVPSVSLPKKILSIMHVNNEIGTVQDLTQLAEKAHSIGCLFHTDATQSWGKIPINVAESKIDFLSATGHKIGAPKGVGFLYWNKDASHEYDSHGSQEFGLRAGTENVPYIVGLAKAIEITQQRQAFYHNQIKQTRNEIFELLKYKVPDIAINGYDIYSGEDNRIYNNLNIRIPGVKAEQLVMLMDEDGVAISAGSACHAHDIKPSHVLKAIGLSDKEAESSIRITLNQPLYPVEISRVVNTLIKNINMLRSYA